jgi:hypothetical protein
MWFAALLGTLVACSVDDLLDDIGIPGIIDDGAALGTEKSLQTDGSAEERITLKTGASLSVPKGAVDHAVTLTMKRPNDKDAVVLVKSLRTTDDLASAPYVLTPHGTKFKQPVSIELPVNKQNHGELVVGWLENENDTRWKKLGTPTLEGGKAKIEVDHFSVLILLEADAAGLTDDAADAGPADAASAAEDAGALAASDAEAADAPDAGSTTSVDDAGATGQADAEVAVFPDAGAASADLDAGNAPDSDAATADGGFFDASPAPDAAPALDDAGVSDPDAGTGMSSDAGLDDASYPDAGIDDAGYAPDAAGP